MNQSFGKSLPEKFVTNIRSLCGKKGELWLYNLPDLISQLEREWSITVGSHFPTLSYNYVASAKTFDGEPAVLKIALPVESTEMFGEMKYLSLLDGHGCPRLLRKNEQIPAILIERAVPGETLREIFRGREDDALPVLLTMMERTRRAVPPDTSNLIQLDDWFDGLRRADDTDFPTAYAERSLQYYQEMSSEKEKIFLLHGDLHHENILSAAREPYLAIDPKAIVGHIGYEIAVFLNNHLWWIEWKTDAKKSLAYAVDLYATEFGMTAHDLRKWAFSQMVLTTWWSYDEMKENFAEGLGFADIWEV